VAFARILRTQAVRTSASISAATAPAVRPSTSLETNEVGIGPAFLTAGEPPFDMPRSGAEPKPRSSRRWTVAAWSFLRGGDGSSLAAGGTLGGGQAGLRGTYRLLRGVALSARLAGPLRRPTASEAALGFDLVSAKLPVHLLVERRQAIGRGGRSAFGATLYGGVREQRIGPFRLDTYAQAGVVGARSRHLFADGGATIALPLTKALRAGAGAWAAAQPGVSRADLGPRASLRLPLTGRTVSVAADWRFRVAGSARPGSGPTLTLASDF
jgi:hypothetical protein